MAVRDLDTGGVVAQAKIGGPGLAVYELATAGMLVATDGDTVTALDNRGDVVWRLRGSRGAPAGAGYLSGPLVADLSGRRICALSYKPPGEFAVVALEAQTGRLTGTVLAGEALSSFSGFSPLGTMLAITSSGGVGLVDWSAGQVLFKQMPGKEAEASDVRVRHVDAISASDSPARVAGPLWADCVFDQTGRLIWYNHVASGTSRRLVLSSDGMRLGTVLGDWAERGRGPTVSSVVVYGLPADGQALPGLR